MTITWDAGTAITGEGSIAGASHLARVVFDTIPGYLSHDSSTPIRYRYLGTVGEYRGTSRDVGASVRYADQSLNSEVDQPDGWYYVLVTGVSGTLYRGVEMSTSLAKACTVRRSTNQSIPNSADTAISFDTEVNDPYGMHSPGTNPTRITVPEPGIYAIVATVDFEVNVAARINVQVAINGGNAIGSQIMTIDAGNSSVIIQATAVWPMDQGDYVETYVKQESGAARNALALGIVYPSMSLVKVG